MTLFRNHRKFVSLVVMYDRFFVFANILKELLHGMETITDTELKKLSGVYKVRNSWMGCAIVIVLH